MIRHRFKQFQKTLGALLVLAAVVLLYAVPFSLAQNNQGAGATLAETEASEDSRPEIEIVPDMMPSILFNKNDYDSIQDARNSIGKVRPPTDREIARDFDEPEEEKVKPPPEKRYIRLGGIVYVDSNDWTIWLNETRVTPKALPYEVLDLRVFNDYIEIKWFDDYSNQILPIRLRANQRFNIDTRIFLPG